MSILMKKQRGIFVFTGIAKLAVTGFIVALSSSLIDTIWAVYMDSFVNSIVLVGFISAFLTVVSFFSYFLFIPLIEKTNKSRMYFLTLIMFAISYILFAINTKFYLFIILAFVVTILMSLKITCFGIIVKDKSREKQLSRNEGLMYTFFNLAWVIGPLIAGYISESFGIKVIFILSSIFIFIAALSFKLSKIKDVHIKKKVDTNFIKNFVDFFKDKNRMKAYIINGGQSLWWVLIYLFMPLYIIRNNLHILWVGYFLFAVTVPLILSEFPFSKLAGKIGFKKLFITGFLILALISLASFLISGIPTILGLKSIYIVLGLLALASFGMAMLEPTTEAYFFDITKDEEEPRFYGPYNTSMDLNFFVGKVLSSTLLIFLPFKYIFLLFAFFMAFFVFFSFKIKDVIEEKKKK